MGELDINYARSFFEKWIEEEKDYGVNNFILPKLIYELFRKNELDFVGQLEIWINSKDEKFKKICILALHILLQEISYFLVPSLNPIYRYYQRAKNLVKEYSNDWLSKEKEIAQRIKHIKSRLQHIIEDRSNSTDIDDIITNMDKFLRDYKTKSLVLNLIFMLLINISHIKGIDTTALTRKFHDKHFSQKVITCQELLHKIENKSIIIDYNKIKKNLVLFSHINRFFGEWFKREEQIDDHPFLILLSDMSTSPETLEQLVKDYNDENYILKKSSRANRIRRYKYLQAILAHIDGCLEKFGTTEQGVKFIRRLKQKDNFYQTLSQLEVAAFLKKACEVTLEKDVGGCPIDMECKLNNNNIIFEVTSIDMLLKLKYGYMVVDIENKTKDTINKKLNEQVSKYPENLSLPIILVIDKTRSKETDVGDLEDVLFGPLSVVVKSSYDSNFEEPYLDRNPQNSVIYESKTAKRLSAIVLYEEYFCEDDSTIRLKGNIFKNPVASIKLDDNVISELTNILFKDPVYY